MSGKPRGCVGKPKQDPDWRAESTEGHLLPQSWVAAGVCGQELKTVPFTNCYSKTKKRKKRLWNKNCFDRLCVSAHSGLVYAEFRSVPRNSNSLSLPVFSLVLILCSLHVKTQVSYTLCFAVCFCARAKPANQSQLKKRNRKGKYRCFLKMCRSSTEITKKPWRVQPGPVTSKSLWGQSRCTPSFADPPPAATRQLSHVCLMSCASFTLLFLAVSCIPSCENTVSSSLLSLRWFSGVHRLVFRFEWEFSIRSERSFKKEEFKMKILFHFKIMCRFSKFI